MKLRDFRNICRKHIHEDGCIKCPGHNDKTKSCLFCKPPHAWSNEEITNYKEKLRRENYGKGNSFKGGDKVEGNARSANIHKTGIC